MNPEFRPDEFDPDSPNRAGENTPTPREQHDWSGEPLYYEHAFFVDDYDFNDYDDGDYEDDYEDDYDYDRDFEGSDCREGYDAGWLAAEKRYSLAGRLANARRSLRWKWHDFQRWITGHSNDIPF